MPRVIRWMGAYGKQNGLEQALMFELFKCNREVAAEPLFRGKSGVYHAAVGLEVARNKVGRRFTHDVGSGTVGYFLQRGRDCSETHGEAFCAPVYSAIVVCGEVSSITWATIKKVSRLAGIPIKRMPAKYNERSDW